MSAIEGKPVPGAVFNLPNQLTSLRLLLSVVMFFLIPWEFYWTCLVLFVVAAGTDWLDGYYARKYGQVTTLGRILDPFADKVIICGTFIFLAAIPRMLETPWGIRPWMVVVIVGRELLVTALRSFLEQRGRLLGQDVGQAEDAPAVHCRRRAAGLPLVRPPARRPAGLGLVDHGPVDLGGRAVDRLLGLDLRRRGSSPVAEDAAHPMNNVPQEVGNPLVTLGVLLIFAACVAIWAQIVYRLIRGLPILPYTPRRMVPWKLIDVVGVLLGYMLLFFWFTFLVQFGFGVRFREAPAAHREAAVVEKPAADQPQADEPKPDLAHPLIVLLRSRPNPVILLFCVLIAAVVAPVAEEIMFRLLLQGWLEAFERRHRRRWAVWRRLSRGIVPVVLVSALFAARISASKDASPIPTHSSTCSRSTRRRSFSRLALASG